MELGCTRKCSPVCAAARMTFCLRTSWCVSVMFRVMTITLSRGIAVRGRVILRILLRELAHYFRRGKWKCGRIGGSQSRLSQRKLCSLGVVVCHSGSSHLLPGGPVVWIANRSRRWEGWTARLPLYFLAVTDRGHSSSPLFRSRLPPHAALPACIAPKRNAIRRM